MVVDHNFTLPLAQPLHFDWPLGGRPLHTHTHPLFLSIFLFFCPLISHQGVCVCVCWGILNREQCENEWWPTVLCTRFDLSRCNPPWLPLPPHTPQPLHHGRTFIHHHHHPPPLFSAPTHMPSSLAEPHNYFLWETYCLCAASIFNYNWAKAGLRRQGPASCFDDCTRPSTFLFFFPGKCQNAYMWTPVWPHSIIFSLAVRGCKAWYLHPKQLANAWIRSWFSGGDISLTMVSVLFCSDPVLPSACFDPRCQQRLCSFWRKHCQWGLACVRGEWRHQCACTVCFEECFHLMHAYCVYKKWVYGF